ncbi:unnamed protein product, partial [Natator depressus]
MDQNPALNPLLSEGDSGLTLEELSSESSPDTSKNSTDLCCPFTALTRRLDFTWGNILRLGLVSGVLLALVLIMAEAGYCWKETPGEPGSSHAETKISLGEEPYLLGGLHRAEKPLSLPPGNPCFRESHIYSMVLPTQQLDPWEQTLDPRHQAHQPLCHQLREHLPGPQGVGKRAVAEPHAGKVLPMSVGSPGWGVGGWALY